MKNQKKFFRTLAGNSDIWDTEFNNSKTPIHILQEDQFLRGRRITRLVKMFNGWGVFVEMYHLFDQLEIEKDTVEWVIKNTSKQNAVNHGVTWARDNLTRREFIASHKDIKDIVEITDLKRTKRSFQ